MSEGVVTNQGIGGYVDARINELADKVQALLDAVCALAVQVESMKPGGGDGGGC